MMQDLDPARLALSGLHVIEASAGTGKTWTLSALYVRLVLGHGLRSLERDSGTGFMGFNPPEILVMTFTEAATAELRSKIRLRLTQAAEFFRGLTQALDGVVALPRDESEHTLSIAQREQEDSLFEALKSTIDKSEWGHCAERLELCAQWMDEAAIFTIHAWSARMLKEHAFESRSLFEQTLTDDSESLRLEASQKYWREYIYPLSTDALNNLLDNKFPETPADLLRRLEPRLLARDKSPHFLPSSEMSPREFDELLRAAKVSARAAWSFENRHEIEQAITVRKDRTVLPKYSKNWLAAMLDWHNGADIDTEILERFTVKSLVAKNWPKAADNEQLMAIDRCVALLKDANSTLSVLNHAASRIYENYEAAKAQRGQFDYSDLLKNLHSAVHLPGSKLASTVRAQYPVALVDEFQDTDPWQYETLRKIYIEAMGERNALILIGDPKQSIYGFRGADLKTYLAAKEDAGKNIHTLRNNYRSTAQLISAVNHIFSNAREPFGAIGYARVSPGASVACLSVNGHDQTALTAWYLPSEKELTKDELQKQMSDVFAVQMLKLLKSGSVRSSDMAVLVRGYREAGAIRAALAKNGVRSVYLSENDSVFASEEAVDLRTILQAVANPKSTKHVRSALATGVWGLSVDELEQTLRSESQWDALVENFHRYQQCWQQQGFLPMLYTLLHENAVAKRLLGREHLQLKSGERVLTNLLHLGDVLQAVSQKLHGETALIRYLEQLLREPASAGDTGLLRLESEAELVQVITIHKSKGLEYPLVFLPFFSSYREEKVSKDPDEAALQPTDDERVDEDIRLLYVALTRAQRALWVGLAPVKETFVEASPEISEETDNEFIASRENSSSVDSNSPLSSYSLRSQKSAFSALLGRQSAGDLVERLRTVWGNCLDILIEEAPCPVQALEALTAEEGFAGYSHLNPNTRSDSTNMSVSREPRARLVPPWWTASFSTIVKGADQYPEQLGSAVEGLSIERIADSQIDASQAVDDGTGLGADYFPPLNAEKDLDQTLLASAQTASPYAALTSSSALGTVLHELLEWQFNQGWPIDSSFDAGDSPSANMWQTLLERRTRKLLLDADQRSLLSAWVYTLVSTELSSDTGSVTIEPFRLLDLHTQNAWAEMHFTLEVSSTFVCDLDKMICHSILEGKHRPELQNKQLNGMLSGIMDLVFEQGGRYFVLDYKSNALSGYLRNDLINSVLFHRYDVQYTLYVLALHRLLKSRLQGYDYDVHIGGAIYFYLRGVQSAQCGLFVDRPPKALILAIDAAFQGGGVNAKHCT